MSQYHLRERVGLEAHPLMRMVLTSPLSQYHLRERVGFSLKPMEETMANTWKCLFCGNLNDLNDQFRQVGDNVCSDCGKGRYLPLAISAIVVVLIVGMGGLVYWMLGMGERNYQSKFAEYYQNDKNISDQERAELVKLAKQVGLKDEAVKKIEAEVIKTVGEPPPVVTGGGGVGVPPTPQPTTGGTPQPTTPAGPTECVVKVFRKNPQGAQVGVASDFPFRNGDEVRLNIETKQDGYLYLIQKGSSGRLNVLFPDKRIAKGAHSVKANQPMVIPGEGWFKFDTRPGTETIYVVYSQTVDKTLFETIEQAKNAESSAKIFTELDQRSQNKANPSPPAEPGQTGTRPPLILSGPGTIVGVLKLNHE